MISTDRMTMRCNFPIGAARSTVTGKFSGGDNG